MFTHHSAERKCIGRSSDQNDKVSTKKKNSQSDLKFYSYLKDDSMDIRRSHGSWHRERGGGTHLHNDAIDKSIRSKNAKNYPKRNSTSRESQRSERFNEENISSPLSPLHKTHAYLIPNGFLTAGPDSKGDDVTPNGKRPEEWNNFDKMRGQVDLVKESHHDLENPLSYRPRSKSFPQPSCVLRKTINPFIEDFLLEDVPAIIHSGSGKRGDERLEAESSQDIKRVILFSQSQSPEVNAEDEQEENPLFVRLHSEPILELKKEVIVDVSSELAFIRGLFTDNSSYHSISSLQNSQPKQYTADTIFSEDRSLSVFPQNNELRCHSPVYSDERNNALLWCLMKLSRKLDFDTLTVWIICTSIELNTHALPNAEVCNDYMNKGSCQREMDGFCTYRHLPSDHIEIIVDKIKCGMIPVSLIRRVGCFYLLANMPGCGKRKGELNPYAPIRAPLCRGYNLFGVIEAKGMKCLYRHLVRCHPERIAFLYFNGRLSKEEINAWQLTPCEKGDVNPFSKPNDPHCYDFENSAFCRRNKEGKVCRFRHIVDDVDKYWNRTNFESRKSHLQYH